MTDESITHSVLSVTYVKLVVWTKYTSPLALQDENDASKFGLLFIAQTNKKGLIAPFTYPIPYAEDAP